MSSVESITLCWDCAKATGGCAWSDRLRPVKGWKAKELNKQNVISYVIYECPEFERDAYRNGARRWPERDTKNMFKYPDCPDR